VSTFATGWIERGIKLATAAAALAAAAHLSGCSTTGAPDGPRDAAQSQPPSIAASTLGPALRCMDGLLLDHGVRDLSLVIDEGSGTDQQGQSSVDSHLAATFSDMTQRSRAIRLVMRDADPEAAVGKASRQQDPAGPSGRQYALRANFAPNVGAAPQGRTMGLELTLLNARDMSVVPGTGRYNEISLPAGPAGFSKFGQPFSVAAATTPASATRALVELSAIELVGRLTRLPYWTCFGLDDGNEAVGAEVQDWYDALAARPDELITYFQQALRQRGIYHGPIDASPNVEFKEAVARTRESLGQPREPKLSLEFFKAWLVADAATLQAAAAPASPPPSAQEPLVTAIATPNVALAAGSPAPPLTLRVSADGDARRFARGEPVNLSIRPSREANVYCFLRDDRGQVVRFFPNRFQRDSRVLPEVALSLPGHARYRLVLNPRGITETVACFATDRDVLAELPGELTQADLVPLPAVSLGEVKAAFVSVSGGALAYGTLELRAR